MNRCVPNLELNRDLRIVLFVWPVTHYNNLSNESFLKWKLSPNEKHFNMSTITTTRTSISDHPPPKGAAGSSSERFMAGFDLEGEDISFVH